ncbi:hypothetical protein GCM10027289_28740 [Tsukamurella serpentis]
MDVLPSLARAGIARTFDPALWPEGTVMAGDELLIGGEPAARTGPVRASSSSPVAVVWVTRMVRSGPVVLCDVEGALPTHATLADAAWPGASLAGARMRQLLVRGAHGVRLAARVEVPADVPVDALLALALRWPRAAATGAGRGCA